MNISGIPLVEIAPPSLLGVVFLLVLTDRLVWHKRLDVLTRRIEVQDELINELTKQNTELINSMGTVNAFLTALKSAADLNRRGDGDVGS